MLVTRATGISNDYTVIWAFFCTVTSKFIDEVGRYNPCVHPHMIELDQEKIDKWVANGAQLSDTVERLLKQTRENA